MALAFCGEPLGHGVRDGRGARDAAAALEQLLHGFLVQRCPVVGKAGEQQVFFSFIGLDGQTGERQIAALAAQRFDNGDTGRVAADVEVDLGGRRVGIPRLGEHMLAQRVREPVEELASTLRLRVNAGDQVVPAGGNILAGRADQFEGEGVVIEARLVGQHVARERPEAPADPVQPGPGIRKPHAQPFVHVLVEVLEQRPSGVFQPGADLFVHLRLQGLEGGVDLLRGPALLVDREDALFEVHAGFDRAQHLVGGAEHAAEQVELLLQQLQNAAVGLVALIEEVDDHHVVLLAVAMAAADALFDALRVPGQVVVDDQ